MALGSLANQFDNRLALSFRGSSVLQQSYPIPGYAFWTPAALFNNGEQGVWYDPSDLTTMFEDSAGTTPVHKPGNGNADSPVGKILDKSGRGNHASQATSTARPTLSAKYNQMTYTEQFDNGFWVRNNVSVLANQTIDPLGSLTGDSITATNVNNSHAVYTGTPPTISSGVNYTMSFYAKTNTHQYVYVACNGGALKYASAAFDLNGVTGQATQTSVGSGGGTVVSTSQQSVSNGWSKLTITFSVASTSLYVAIGIAQAATGNTFDTGGNVTFSAAGTESIYIWGADLRVSNDGVGLPTYQRVVDANTYDSVGFPYYLKFDGVDDNLATNSIDFTSTGKVTVSSALRNQSSNLAIYSELSVNASVNNGSWHIVTSYNASTYYRVLNNGGGGSVSTVNATSAIYAAPVSNVITFFDDIANDNLTLRLNNVQIDQSTNDQGVTNYGNYPLYLGSRSGGSFAFNGKSFGFIVRGVLSTAIEITNTESWLNRVAKIY